MIVSKMNDFLFEFGECFFVDQGILILKCKNVSY
jgi:hypothetical protein